MFMPALLMLVAPTDFTPVQTSVEAAIEKGQLPGAVVLVLQRDETIYRKAFGQRALRPARVPMTEDTLFDLASLTKPIATATCIWLLIEDGKIHLSDPIAKYLSGFKRKSTEDITIEQLLLHTSGFIADNPLTDYQDGRDKAWERLFALDPITRPGGKFAYSDVGYILLGAIVEKVSGKPLDQFAKERIFDPLEMRDTTFHPSEELKKRAAPTEQRDGKWMLGEVHDPRSYLLGGVAGDAGLFSTADDLARFARMLFHEGKAGERVVMRHETVHAMIAKHEIPLDKGTGLRTLGWDMATPYSSLRGEIFASGVSFGHTGFTGTSIWIDPEHRIAVILLSNRVHPDGKGNIVKLRTEVSTIVGKALLR